jgi:NAD dependent epimerase/dehydratase family enzyme
MNVTAPEPVRNREFARTLGQALRRPSWLPLPALALQIAFGELGNTLLGGQRVLPSRLTAAGYQFQQPRLLPALRQGLGVQP